MGTILTVIAAIMGWQLVTLVVVGLSDEDEKIHFTMSCGLWIIAWNGAMHMVWRARDKRRRKQAAKRAGE